MSGLPADECSRRQPMAWQDDPARRAKARELWNLGWTCARIASALHCSKNAVIGAAHRWDFPKRPSPIRPRDPEAHEQKLERRRRRFAERRAERLKSAVVGLLTNGEGLKPEAPVAPAHPRNGGSHICPTDTLPPLTSTLTQDSGPPEPPSVPRSRLRPIAVKKPLAGSLGALTGMPQSCQWPIGDPRAINPITGSACFLFCEAPPIAGRPYCAEHARRAYLPLGAKP